ncbi:MAG: hypothetical protein AB7G93_07520 [Bdellovibrionales bacterium]
MQSLLRYLNPEEGPIVSLGSALQPGLSCPLYWYSVARLASAFDDRFSYRFQQAITGAGWSRSKHESQCKAIVEAMERVAHRHCRANPKSAGLDLDSSTTGFAALPMEFDIGAAYENALAESLERWVLNRVSDRREIPLHEVEAHEIPLRMRALFWGRSGNLRVFRAWIMSGEREMHFALALFQLSTGGIVPGSASHTEWGAALEKSLLESFNHLRKIDRILGGSEQLPPKITIQRLWHFGFNIPAAAAIMERLRQWTHAKVIPVSGPEMSFRNELHGPWEPEIRVVRVLVEDSPPLGEGGLERFIV